jgi:hypothetical protein
MTIFTKIAQFESFFFVTDFETGKSRTDIYKLFEVLPATIINAVVFLVMISRVHVDGGSMFLRNTGSYLPGTWSHNPGHKRYVQFAATEFWKRKIRFLLNTKSLSSIWSSGNYASVQLRKDKTRRSNSNEGACSKDVESANPTRWERTTDLFKWKTWPRHPKEAGRCHGGPSPILVSICGIP